MDARPDRNPPAVEDHPVIKAINRGAARSYKQRRHNRMNDASDTRNDHRGAEAARRAQMLAITLADAAGVFKKQALNHLVPPFTRIRIGMMRRNLLLIFYTLT
jgi:hypothetical protein